MQDAARDICKAISIVIIVKKGGLQPNEFSRSQMLWTLCTKVGRTEKSVAMWSCVLAFRYTHLCVCFVAHCGPSVWVRSQQTQSQCPLLGLLVGSPGSCSVFLLRVATLPSAGRTTITVTDSNTWKTLRNFYYSLHIVGFIKSMMTYGAERRLSW